MTTNSPTVVPDSARLEHPETVLQNLRSARLSLGLAHSYAGETERGATDLNGPVRDALFALNSMIDALEAMIEDRLYRERQIDGTDADVDVATPHIGQGGHADA